MRSTRLLSAFALAAFVAACATREPAPVVDRGPAPTPPKVEAPAPAEKPEAKPVPTYVVKKGDTLVGIALANGLDYRELAAWNNIAQVNVISVGQLLVLQAPAGSATPVATPLSTPGPPIEARPLANTPQLKVEPRGQKVPYNDRALAQLSTPESGPPIVASAPPVVPTPAPTPPVAVPAPAEPPKPTGTDAEDVDWMWPVKGRVLSTFTEASKGMDISGKKGAPVVAAASGRVVYAGAGLRGYGKLVIIKHNDTWLSAYAHNDSILVKEQQDVKKGQKIAEMGSSDTDQVKLHFEVRRQGKPVDPAKILPAS